MRTLLRKELRLALHPTAPLFVALAAMVLIPNYPYEVIFFYLCLGVFFICLTGRENRDVAYSLLLPIPKGAIVTGRIALTVCLQLAQLAALIPCVALRYALMGGENLAGLDAGVALFGLGLALFGLFNLAFFPAYYRNPDKVGRPFLYGCLAMFVGMSADMAAVFALPFARDVLDTPDPAHLPEKLAVLLAGALLYAAATWAAWRVSRARFVRTDQGF